jgi:hypothetical protein
MTRLVLLLLALAAVDCNDQQTAPTPIPATATSPTPTPTPTPTPSADIIEFRVTGNVTEAAITTTDPFNGNQITVTSLPYSLTVNSTRASAFVAVDAQTLTATSVTGTFVGNYVLAQIYVNGTVFLQATDFAALPHATVSGTWRR